MQCEMQSQMRRLATLESLSNISEREMFNLLYLGALFPAALPASAGRRHFWRATGAGVPD